MLREGLLSWSAVESQMPMPRNPAFLASDVRPIQVRDVATGSSLELVAVGPDPRPGELHLVALAEPLPPGATIEVLGGPSKSRPPWATCSTRRRRRRRSC